MFEKIKACKDQIPSTGTHTENSMILEFTGKTCFKGHTHHSPIFLILVLEYIL